MNLKTVFKKLILLDFLIIILTLISFAFDSAVVTDFNKNFENDYSNSLITVAGILTLVYIVNLFFLYKFKRIAKQIYLPLWIVSVIVVLLVPPFATDSWSYVLDGLGFANTGAILVLLYFTPIKKEFDK